MPSVEMFGSVQQRHNDAMLPLAPSPTTKVRRRMSDPAEKASGQSARLSRKEFLSQ